MGRRQPLMQKNQFSKETMNDFEKIKRGTSEILPAESLMEKLEESRKKNSPLKIKAGFDPTAPDLHLGHLVLLRKMKHFQELGHEVNFLIGDFTGMIGDPTGRSVSRKQMTAEEVAENARTYETQVFKILDRNKTKVVFNSKWCRPMKFEDVLGLTARYTVARMIERDDFSKRLAAGDPISLIELLYPLIQGYDSVVMKSDVELGGTDQKFNLLVGRELQKEYGLSQQVIVTTPLLIGTDGQKKMSKSYGNYIGINETPYQMFAKVMSISDELMWDYYILLTDIPEKQIAELKKEPFEAKKFLAETIIESLHPAGSGKEARSGWEAEKGKAGREKMVLPPDTPVHRVDKKGKVPIIEIIVGSGLEKSNSAVRRLIESGAIRLGEDLMSISDLNYVLEFPGKYSIKIGKKKYLIVEG